jgi:hypothetical protein
MSTKRRSVLWSILFVLLYTGPPKFRIRDFDASLLGQFDLPVLIQIGVYLFAGVFVARKINEKWHEIHLGFTQKVTIALLVTLAFSGSISVDPELTFFKTYQFAMLFLFAGLFLNEFGVSRTLQHLIVGNAILCALVVAAIPFIPTGILEFSETDFPRLRGSAIAETGVVGLFLCVLLLTEKERRSWLLLAFAAIVTFFSLSRTSWGCAVAILALIVLCRPRVWSLSLARIACSAVMLTIILVGTARLTGSFRDAPTEDLSGRTEIWAYTTAVVLSESPWRGLGYGVASRTLVADLDPTLGSAHSAFVDVFLAGGFIALSVFLLLYLALTIDSVRIVLRRRDASAFATAALFLTVLVLSVVGGEVDAGPFLCTFCCLIWMISRVRQESSVGVSASGVALPLPSERAEARFRTPALPPPPPADAG